MEVRTTSASQKMPCFLLAVVRPQMGSISKCASVVSKPPSIPHTFSFCCLLCLFVQSPSHELLGPRVACLLTICILYCHFHSL